MLDLTELGDSHMSKLPEDVVELLTENNSLKEVNLPKKARTLLDEFVKSYEQLRGTDFRLTDMDGISYPAGIQNPQLRADMGMIWSVLNGL